MSVIIPCLWYPDQTAAVLDAYTATFPRSRIASVQHYPDNATSGPLAGMSGKILTAIFELAGQEFMALDGGDTFKFTPAISQFVSCATEAELDALWTRLSAGGQVLLPLQAYPFSPKFGWVQDRFGLSWQLDLAARSQMIAPFLMFTGDQHGKAEAAIRFYTSVFPNSAIETLRHYGAGDPQGTAGTVEHAIFQLAGYDFMATDSAIDHGFGFTGATSFVVNCADQAEIDYYWERLSADPEAEACGWLKDKYGISWQIFPMSLNHLLLNPATSGRVMDAMMPMKKIDMAALIAAAG